MQHNNATMYCGLNKSPRISLKFYLGSLCLNVVHKPELMTGFYLCRVARTPPPPSLSVNTFLEVKEVI